MRTPSMLLVTTLSVTLLFPSISVSSDLSDRLSEKRIQKHLKRKHFNELGSLASASREAKLEMPDGVRPLAAFYDHIVNLDSKSSDKKWRTLIKRLEQWRSDEPQSQTSRVALAKAYRAYAWKGRGPGFAPAVTESGWKLFYERLEKAGIALGSHITFTDPQAYVEMIELTKALALLNKKEQAYNWFHKGIEIDPDYYPLYTSMAFLLTRRWDGEPGEWEAFAKEYSDKRGGLEGQILYTRILLYMSKKFSAFDFLSRISQPWAELKEMFENIIESRPDSLADMNAYCYFSCLALDYEAARPLLKQLQRKIVRNKKRIPWIWEWDGEDQFSYINDRISSDARVVFHTNLSSIISDDEELTETLTIYGPKSRERPWMESESQITQNEMAHSISIERHTKIFLIPAGAPAGDYLLEYVVENRSTGKEIRQTETVFRSYQDDSVYIYIPPPYIPKD